MRAFHAFVAHRKHKLARVASEIERRRRTEAPRPRASALSAVVNGWAYAHAPRLYKFDSARKGNPVVPFTRCAIDACSELSHAVTKVESGAQPCAVRVGVIGFAGR